MKTSLIGVLAAILLLAAAVGCLYATAANVRGGEWVQTTVADFQAGTLEGIQVTCEDDGELRLAAGRTTGVFTSAVGLANFPFNAVGAHWAAEVPPGASLTVALRASPDGTAWSPWQEVVEVQQGEDGRFYGGNLLFVQEGRYLQYRLAMQAPDPSLSPVIAELALTYIDSTRGPTLAQATASARALAVGQPAIIPRSGWGADESLRFDDQGNEIWPPEHCPVRKIVVHHTVTSNEADPVETIRAIYYYHAVIRGHGDIGYNYLVDRYGNIYEGRYGGPDVVGAHVGGYNRGSVGVGAMGTYGNLAGSVEPSDELLEAIADLAAWECGRSLINPNESSLFVDKVTPNIAGHRDYNPTTFCPGDYLYAELPALRDEAWQRILASTPQYLAQFLDHDTPTEMLTGHTYGVELTLRNAGTLTWPADGAQPVRLGYRWYDEAGKRVPQPPEDERRTPLSQDVTFANTAVFSPALVTAPREPGRYTLRWDLLQEGVGWFSERGSPTLDVTVTVSSPVSICGRVLDNRDEPVAGARVSVFDGPVATTDQAGEYELGDLWPGTYSLQATGEGYGPTEPVYDLAVVSGTATLDFYLPPLDDVVTNGGFEAGLEGWAATGAVTTTVAHTGRRAALLAGTAWLSQTVIVSPTIYSPTLSFLYSVPISEASSVFNVTLSALTETVVYTPSLTTEGWVHAWYPVDARGEVEVGFGLTGPTEVCSATVYLDEVSLGRASRPVYKVHLPVVMRGFAPPPPCTELIVNGGFEADEGWDIPLTAYPAGYSTIRAHGGDRSMRLGIEAAGDNVESYSSAQQTVAIPAEAASVTLSFWRYPVSGDTAHDLQYAVILDEDGQWVDTLLWDRSDAQEWLRAEYDLTSYAGQTITLRFGVYNDGTGGVTAMYVDDVSLRVCYGGGAQ